MQTASNATPTTGLEDQVFGVDDDDDDDGDRNVSIVGDAARRLSFSADPIGRSVGPLVVVCVITGIAVWSISKSVQYHEMFAVNSRYRYGLYAVNASLILVTVVVLCVQQQRAVREALKMSASTTK